jgi:uncharacterized protein YuzE
MKPSSRFVRYDQGSDTVYIVAGRGKEEEFVEVAPGVHVELDAKGDVIGIEILRASKFFRPIAKPLYRQMQLAS